MKKTWAVLTILLMMVTSLLSPKNVFAETATVHNWKELVAAVNEPQFSEIIIAQDIAVEDSLTINRRLTIKGVEGGLPYFKKSVIAMIQCLKLMMVVI